jgi:arginine repressor
VPVTQATLSRLIDLLLLVKSVFHQDTRRL